MDWLRSRFSLTPALALRLVLGAVFVYAAYVKLRDPWTLFALAIDSYKLLPVAWLEPVARTLPWIELAVGLFLIIGVFVRASSTVMSLLLVVFFSLMVRAYAQGMEISCGCFGPGETISWKTLLRDGSLLAGSLALTYLAFRRRPGTA